MTQNRYNITQTEEKWRKIWDEAECFKAQEDTDKPKYYVLEMFPYPSGRLHAGHAKNYVLGDMVARYEMAKGFSVLHPMGWDAFGLPAENAAIKNGTHPEEWTKKNIPVYIHNLKLLGVTHDWSREIATCDPSYYKHEQKMFLDFYKKGLAYKKESTVNWDPVDNCVLANEQVVDGKGWRSGAPVERKKLKQWFLKITDYADDLLDGLKELEGWPDRVRIMQENWIGRSRGLQFKWDVAGRDDQIDVYTTRPDTLFGASFLALAPDHPLTRELCGDKPGFDDFIKQCNQIGTSETAIEQAEKLGFDTGLKATHPVLGREVPIYIANFILMDYGTGAIFGVPAHDQRDFDFAKKYGLPIRPVVIPEGEDANSFALDNEAYTGEGKLGNSEFLDGLSVEDAKRKIIEKVKELGTGFGTTQYRLRDWGISRQRYWGCPVPVVYRNSDGACIPVPEDQLPVELPKDVTFDKPGNPLDHHPTWKHTTCPETGEPATRETDTFDTFFESSWYQFRFCDPHNTEKGFAKEKADYWMPVDQYIGGIEHAVMHLLYARFFTRALRDCGYTDVKEPFNALFTQGMIIHATYKDQDGEWLYPEQVETLEDGTVVEIETQKPVTVGPAIKMSKSKNNVIDIEAFTDVYGADVLRLFVMSDTPPERDQEWTDTGIEGCWKYINRVYRLVADHLSALPPKGSAIEVTSEADKKLRSLVHTTIKDVSADIERLHMNKAVARIRELSNALEKQAKDVSPVILREGIEVLCQLLNPVTPHLAEEIWSMLGYETLLAQTSWPEADKAALVNDEMTMAIQVNGKLRTTLTLPKDMQKEQIEKTALNDENVAKFTQGKEVRKIIVVPGRIVNIVVAG